MHSSKAIAISEPNCSCTFVATSGDKNWSLRLPNNFEEMQTINLPLILKKAIIARGSEFANANKELIEELDEIQ